MLTKKDNDNRDVAEMEENDLTPVQGLIACWP
jgi:hypothetical protein